MYKIVVLFSLLSLVSFGQEVDTNCVFARWVRVKPNSINSDIFSLDKKTNKKLDLISVVKKHVESNNLNIYSLRTNNNGGLEWVYIDYNDEKEKALSDSTNVNKWSPYFKRFGPEIDQPLADEYGEPLTKIGESGYEEYVYPERDVFDLFAQDLTDIQIKEIRVFDEKTGKVNFTPSDIGFFIKDSELERSKELFWVNLKELFDVIGNKEKYDWYKPIVKQLYKGLMIKQVSCDEPQINYYESNHPISLNVTDSCSCSVTSTHMRRRNHVVVKIPNHCTEGVKVYFEPGGTQTDLTFYKIKADSNEYYGRKSFATESTYNYVTFEEEEIFKVIYSPCHFYSEFRLIIE